MMATLTLKGPRVKLQRKQAMGFSRDRPYVDRGRPGVLRVDAEGRPIRSREPPHLPRVTLTLEVYDQRLRRHNALQPALLGTHRLLLRWGESGGNGLPNPEADVRELHYDPLPPDLHERVDAIVEDSPWEVLTRKWYRTDLTMRELAEVLCVGKTQLYTDWKYALWYYRGCFEFHGVHE